MRAALGEPHHLASRPANLSRGMRKSGSVGKKCSDAAGRDLLAFLAGRSKPEGNEEKWFRREKVQRLCVPHLLGSAVPSLPPQGMRKTGSAEKDCDSGRTSPPGRRWRTEGNEEKWFRKTNVPGSLFVAELKDSPEGREMASLSRDREVEKPAK